MIQIKNRMHSHQKCDGSSLICSKLLINELHRYFPLWTAPTHVEIDNIPKEDNGYSFSQPILIKEKYSPQRLTHIK